MGYYVKIELINVKFKKSDELKIVETLQAYNKNTLIPKNDWCRFNIHSDDIETIIQEMGFSLNEDEIYGYIEEFEGENLGAQEDILRLLAPYLEDCEIKFRGEDDQAWKFKIVNHIASPSEYREEF